MVCFVIFGISSLPGTTVNNIGLGNNLYHINGHFFLYFLLSLALFKATKGYMLSALLSFLYSITDEIHQLFVPGRSFEYIDIIVDAGGSVLALLVIWRLLPKVSMRLKNWLLN